jgi:MFS family permease
MLAVFLLEIGSGLQGVLIPIRGQLAEFPTVLLGGLGTVYYIGFVTGCILLPRTVRRVGHIRCYSALAAIAASLALLHAMVVAPSAWLLFRLLVGVCFAGLFMVTESWLNDQTTQENRGRVLGFYMVVTWLGVISGKMLFSVSLSDDFHLFALASVAVGLSLVPIALTDGAVPAIPQPSRIRFWELYHTAPVGLIGCIAVGLANGAFWSFGPLFGQDRFGPGLGVSLFLTACVVGGAISQWPIGRISDHMDRRWVVFLLCAVSTATGLLLAWNPANSGPATYFLAGLFGVASLSIYSVCIAHANDRADPSNYVDVSSYLLLAFGTGAILGPFIAGMFISAIGISSLFVFTASVEAALAVFVLVRIRNEAPVPVPDRAIFTGQPPLSHGTQAVIELQPIANVEGDQTADAK